MRNLERKRPNWNIVCLPSTDLHLLRISRFQQTDPSSTENAGFNRPQKSCVGSFGGGENPPSPFPQIKTFTGKFAIPNEWEFHSLGRQRRCQRHLQTVHFFKKYKTNQIGAVSQVHYYCEGEGTFHSLTVSSPGAINFRPLVGPALTTKVSIGSQLTSQPGLNLEGK